MSCRVLVLVIMFAAALGGRVEAALITDPGDVLLAGATIIDFSEVPTGTSNPVIGDVRFIGRRLPLTTVFYDFLPALTPPQLSNARPNPLNGVPYNIIFGSPVSSAGLIMTGVNSTTTLWAFDSSNRLLGRARFPIGPLTVDFLGLGGFSDDIARLQVRTRDAVLAERLYFVPVRANIPEPATIALFGLGAVSLGWWRRRKA